MGKALSGDPVPVIDLVETVLMRISVYALYGNMQTVLQIRRGEGENLGIILYIIPLIGMLQPIIIPPAFMPRGI